MFDKEKVDIPCPECKRVSKMTIKEVKRNPSYACPGCQKTITLDADELTRGIKDAEKKLRKLFK